MMLPYYHPTTVVFVDDNDLFLRDLDIRLPARMAYLLYADPAEALVRVNGEPSIPTLANRCFSLTGDTGESWPDSVIQFDIGTIEEEINDTRRLRRTSVVVVDYAMPSMNGLEFCQRITAPNVKKVLLTGVADEKLAVTAFNDGTIDRFVMKHQPDSIELMLEFAKELELEHFRDQQRSLTAALSMNPPRFAEDPQLAQELERLLHKHQFVEHYLVGDPPGYLLLKASGDLQRLVVSGEADFATQIQDLERLGAPPGVLDRIRAREQIACFYEPLDNFGSSDYPWQDYTFDCRRVGAAPNWWLALLDQPPLHIDFDPGRASFDAYLAQLDAS